MSSIRLEVDRRTAEGAGEAVVGSVLRAGRYSVEDATRRLEKDFEDLTRQAVPGRAWRAWRSEVFPLDGRASYEPVGTVYVNGGRRSQGMMAYWTRPGINRAREGQWLAIPTKAAGSRGRGRDLTPGEWERATGIRLDFVYTGRGKTAFLVARGVAANNGSGALRQSTRLRRQRDVASGRSREEKSVPIFVLIPFQRHANRVGLETAIARAEARLVQDFGARLAQI